MAPAMPSQTRMQEGKSRAVKDWEKLLDFSHLWHRVFFGAASIYIYYISRQMPLEVLNIASILLSVPTLLFLFSFLFSLFTSFPSSH